MDVTVVKIILLFIMFAVALACGLFPIKLYGWLMRYKQNKKGDRFSLILSLFSCFAGGVFLAVCFLDMFPDAIDIIDVIEEEANIKMNYPYFELLTCAGFFAVFLIEELFSLVMIKKYNRPRSDTGCKNFTTRIVPVSMNKTFGVTDISIVDNGVSIADSKEILIKDETKINLASALTLVIAITFHSVLEGFAFGLQKTTLSAGSLFLGIIMHKAVVCFSIGMRLVQANPTRRMVTAGFVLLVALTAPLGGAMGIIIENSEMNELRKNIVMAIFICISLGTFLYITFFEILAHERQNEHPNLLQWVAAVVGFALIAIFMIWSH